MFYSNIFYGKELICHEAMDPSVCLNQHASFISFKQHRQFIDHVIFIYFQNQLAMTSKMAARILNYKLGSPSYGDSMLEKRKNFKKKIVYPSSSLRTGFFGCGEEWYHLHGK